MNKLTKKSSWLEKIEHLLMREPEDKEQLIELLHASFEKNLLDSDALSMLEGVLQVSEMAARDTMIPRSQCCMVDIKSPMADIINLAVDTNHSRFPVYENNKDAVLGVLLAKDLLRYYKDPESFDLRDMLRPAVFIPESKRLNVLLKDFRSNRNHMAIVVDEYSGVAGLITIEDVLEQIVGEIEDEYDFDESEANILEDKSGQYRIKAVTEISDINEHFGTNFPDTDFDTIGGLVLAHLGKLPEIGETFKIGELGITVTRADSRRIYTLLVKKIEIGKEI
ncbi:MAG: CBS domain-containing protein [Betaproteobacteria bacterium]|nr:CBS domain-containing protein [Betaproteobacteria bacterium]